VENIGQDDCLDVFCKFYDMKSKDQQDILLQGLIDVAEVQRRRPSKNANAVRRVDKVGVFKYHVIIGSTRQEVCFSAFLSLFSISEKRVRRIRHLKLLGRTPEDKRGKHVSHRLDTDLHKQIHEHIKSFPLKLSHYCGKRMYYLSADLSLKLMWKMFCEKYQVKVSQTTYWRVYKDNFNYRFGRPQVDTCCLCEELNLKIKSPHLNDVAKRAAVAELLVHKRKGKKFYAALKHEQSDDGKKESNVLALSFDFMKTISLPKLPIQELYYMRQLSVNIFGITNIKERKTDIYLYHEGLCKKSPNEVCSFLNDYLKSVPDKYTELHFYCDNFTGQNKNQALARFCMFLTDSKKFKKVVQYFPVRGHSFLPCDRDFGVISKALKSHDRIFTVHELTQIIINSTNKPGKMLVHEVSAEDIFDFKSWAGEYYKKSCVSEETRGRKTTKENKVYFQITTLFHFEYDEKKKGSVKAFTSVNGLICHNFIMGKTPGPVLPPTTLSCPQGKWPIKRAKADDLLKLKPYKPNEHSEFYNETS